MTTVPLGDIIVPANVRRAGDADFPLLSMTMRNGLVDQSTKFKKRVASNDVSTYKVIRRGQLVVGFPIDEGVLDFQDLYDAGIVSPAYGVWDLRSPETISRTYLKRYLRSPAAMAYYKAKLRGSTARRRSLPAEVFLALPVPAPPLDEQRRIATILDRADVIRTKRRQILTHLDTLTQSVFHDMFGDPVDNPRGLEVELLDQLIEAGRPITYGILKPGPQVDDGVPYIRVADMKGGGILLDGVRKTDPAISSSYKRSLLRQGDLLMSIRGHVGRFAQIPAELDGANITQDSARLSISDPATSAYVRAAMSAPGLQRWMARHTKGVAVRGLNIGDLRKVPIPIPPAASQREFAERAERVNAQRSVLQRALAADDELFSSLQSRAFRGEM